jgi:hypothetical protein
VGQRAYTAANAVSLETDELSIYLSPHNNISDKSITNGRNLRVLSTYSFV